MTPARLNELGDICISLNYTPAQYYELRQFERAAIVRASNRARNRRR